MGSISEKIRIKQKDEAEAVVKARLNVLTKAGMEEKDQERDPKLKAAKAELRKAIKRLKAIADRDNHVKEAKEKKAGSGKKKKGGGKKAGGKGGGKAKKPKKEKKEKKAKKA